MERTQRVLTNTHISPAMTIMMNLMRQTPTNTATCLVMNMVSTKQMLPINTSTVMSRRITMEILKTQLRPINTLTCHRMNMGSKVIMTQLMLTNTRIFPLMITAALMMLRTPISTHTCQATTITTRMQLALTNIATFQLMTTVEKTIPLRLLLSLTCQPAMAFHTRNSSMTANWSKTTTLTCETKIKPSLFTNFWACKIYSQSKWENKRNRR